MTETNKPEPADRKTDATTTQEGANAQEKHPMFEVSVALLAGFIVGILFSAIRLPLPAPPAIAGVMGIVGIYLGGAVYAYYFG